tara:strand:+ start:508 stop:867 length:360 start_codon:yes stop_codon:yes gene_type:complete
MSAPFKMKGHTLPGPNQASPAKHKKYSKAKGDINDHGPERKHPGTSEAHNIKPKPKPKEKMGKAAYGNKDQGGGVQTYKEYANEINKPSSPAKIAPLIAAVAPMVIKAVAGKAMEKKEK